MSIIYILIPIAIILTAVGIYLFFWAVKTEQFEDLEKQGLSILFDEDEPIKSSLPTKSTENNIVSDDGNSHPNEPLQK